MVVLQLNVGDLGLPRASDYITDPLYGLVSDISGRYQRRRRHRAYSTLHGNGQPGSSNNGSPGPKDEPYNAARMSEAKDQPGRPGHKQSTASEQLLPHVSGHKKSVTISTSRSRFTPGSVARLAFMPFPPPPPPPPPPPQPRHARHTSSRRELTDDYRRYIRTVGGLLNVSEPRIDQFVRNTLELEGHLARVSQCI